jgi:hypothetical protein
MMLYGTIQCFPHWGLYGYEIERITAQFTCLEQVRWTQWMCLAVCRHRMA